VPPCTYDAAVVENDQPQCAPGSPVGASSLPLSISDQLTWVLVAIIASAYFFGLTPGHVFAQDDFAAYVMQAANLVEHRRYTDIRYVPNSEAPWVSPANGYPPVYPLLLAPVYWLRGLDLHAMKMVTVFTFAIFLAAFAKWVRPMVSPRLRVVAVLLVGLSPAFWNYRDLISSEFPYLMFSFLALLAIRRGSDVGGGWQQAGWALLAALLLYASYGTRTIGIALPGALLGAELMRQRKPGRFVMLVLGVFAGFAMVQSVLLTSPSGYMAVAHFSTTSVVENVANYAKSLSHAWESGFSQAAQGGLTVVFSRFAALAFWKRFREGSLEAFYVVIYLGILIAWGAQIGVRGLLPVLPIYLTYVVLGITEAVERWKKPKARALVAAVAVCMAITYFGGLRQRPWQAALANVNDTSAQELFTFLRSRSQPSDVLLFSKPRSLALFSGRAVGSLGAEEPAGESVRFVRENGVRFVIQSSWTPAAYDQLLASGQFELVFGNEDFRVYRVGERME